MREETYRVLRERSLRLQYRMWHASSMEHHENIEAEVRAVQEVMIGDDKQVQQSLLWLLIKCHVRQELTDVWGNGDWVFVEAIDPEERPPGWDVPMAPAGVAQRTIAAWSIWRNTGAVHEMQGPEVLDPPIFDPRTRVAR